MNERPVSRRWLALELIALNAVALGLPVLERTAVTADFFTSRDVRPAGIVLFGVLVLLVVPVVLFTVELIAERVSSLWRDRVHAAFVGILLALVALNIANAAELRVVARLHVDPPGWLLLVAAAGAGAVAARLMLRRAGVRAAVRLLGVAPIGALAVFLTSAPLSQDADVDTIALTDPAPVVFLVLDELPTVSLLGPGGSIDVDRVPNFGRLADDAIWWKDATTVADATMVAVPALLSGGRRKAGTAPSAASYSRNLFTLLGGNYASDAVEPVTSLCDELLCRGRDPSSVGRLADDAARVAAFVLAPTEYRDRIPKVVGQAGVFEDPDAAFETFLERIDSEDQPTLDFIHLTLPHHPWNHRASGEIYDEASDPASGLPAGFQEPNWIDDADLVRHNWARHLEQVAYTDRLIGRVLDRLEEIGRYDESLLVVVADHGISFRPGNAMRQATAGNLAEIAAVPLFVKLPDSTSGRRVAGRADTSALLPTVLDALGASDEHTAGSLLRGPSSGPIDIAAVLGGTVTSPIKTLRRQRADVLARQALALTELEARGVGR